MINKNVLPGPLPKIHTKVSPLSNLYYICPNLVHTKTKNKKQAKKNNKQTNKKRPNKQKTTNPPPKKNRNKTNKQTKINK